MLICFFAKMIIQLGIMTCAQIIYINNDNLHYHSSLHQTGSHTFGACVEMTSWIWLLHWRWGCSMQSVCLNVCECVCFQGAIIRRVAISFLLASVQWMHLAALSNIMGWPDALSLCLQVVHSIKRIGNTCRNICYYDYKKTL